MICIKVNLLVKSCLRNEKKEYNIKGILNENAIKFRDDSKIMIINLNNKTLERINNKEKYFFNFKKENCKISTKEFEMQIPIKVVKCTIQNNNFYVKYQIDEDYYEIDIKQI